MSGAIILQSEGAEIFYRDIQVRPIKAIPAEFAEKR
jgi:DNA integrity scanning protein DisA with diadenylate cyclase activity